MGYTKQGWIAGGLAFVMFGALFLVWQKVRPPAEGILVIEPPSKLGRLEWERQFHGRVVMESRADGWWITSPIDAPVRRDVADQIERIFGQTIVSDDTQYVIDPSLDAFFGLVGSQPVDLAIYEEGKARPKTRLKVGSETPANEITGLPLRTFVQVPGEKRIYGMLSGFGDLLRRPLKELRDDQITRSGDSPLRAVQSSHAGGHLLTSGDSPLRAVQWFHADGHLLKIVRAGDERESWESVSPQPGMPLDEAAVKEVFADLQRLKAVGFVDLGDARRRAVNFDRPDVKVTMETDSGSVDLAVVRNGYFIYVQRSDDGQVFEVNENEIDPLMTRLHHVKTRAVMSMAPDAITSVEISGPHPIRLRKGDDSLWTMTEPVGFEIDPVKVRRFIIDLANLGADRWVEGIDPIRVGLTPSKRIEVRVGAHDREEVLYIGRGSGLSWGERYARLASSPEIFVLSADALHHLMTPAHELGVSTIN